MSVKNKMAIQTSQQIQQSLTDLQKRIQTEGITSGATGQVLLAPGAYNPATNTIIADNLNTPQKPIDIQPFQDTTDYSQYGNIPADSQNIQENQMPSWV